MDANWEGARNGGAVTTEFLTRRGIAVTAKLNREVFTTKKRSGQQKTGFLRPGFLPEGSEGSEEVFSGNQEVKSRDLFVFGLDITLFLLVTATEFLNLHSV